MKVSICRFLMIITCCFVVACSPTKFVADGSYLLKDVRVSVPDTMSFDIHPRSYVRQTPNSKWFNKWKVPLSIYSLSGRDSSKWINSFLRRIGESPVVYDDQLTEDTQRDLTRMIQNSGYFSARVNVEKKSEKKRMSVVYSLVPGERYYIGSIKKNIPDAMIERIISSDSASSHLHVGNPLDINRLNSERKRITLLLQNLGYYRFNHDYISFTIDSVAGSRKVDVTMNMAQVRGRDNVQTDHQQYRIGDVAYVVGRDMHYSDDGGMDKCDTLQRENAKFLFIKKLPLRQRVIYDISAIRKGELYKEENIHSTSTNFGRLRAVRYTNIRFDESPNDSNKLNCIINLNMAKPVSVSWGVEGTNSAGDLGAATTLTYQHLNLFKGGEVFTMKLRGAYESVTGLQGYNNDGYFEFGAETSLNFPRFMLPFASRSVRHSSKATSELAFVYNTQNRPEFRRRVASLVWRYRWHSNKQKINHRFDLMELSYVYMPWISEKFKHDYLDSIGQRNAFLRYNYEDLLITKLGYNLSYNSLGGNVTTDQQYGKNVYSIKLNIESSGNLLYGISNILRSQRNSEGQYSVANIAYAQYVKGDFDFARSIAIDPKNSIAFHFGLGIAYPYGNSRILPYEKRYFSGGANSVRGWSVRGLGPGCYNGGDGGHISFLNQMGDMKLDINLEYRTSLFWKISGALFVDAGNIWTLRKYEETPGGEFAFDKFYRQIAVSYGLGLRLNLDYFIIRFDGGMKAVNPAYENSREHFPLLHPRLRRDFAFHFAVGLPF